jgi:AAA15 family ATPase/GTPase
MVYKNLKIKNFRGIKNLELNDLSQINILLGKNNCGKSSILEAIFMLTGVNNPNLTLNIDFFRGIGHTDKNDFRFIFYKLDYKNMPEIESDLDEEEGSRKIKISPKESGSKSISSKKSNSLSSNDSLLSNDDLSDIYNGIEINSEIKKRFTAVKKLKTSISIETDSNGILTFPTKRDEHFKDDLVAVFQNANGVNYGDLYKKLEILKIEKKIYRIVDGLKLIEDRICGMDLLGGNMIYIDIGIERLMPIHLMGDGAIKFTSIISNIERARNGILLIDEIDNGLHFSVLKHIWKIILEMSSKNNVQLFITTHDKETLRYLSEVIEEEDITKINLVSCYTISKDNADNLDSYKYKTDALKFALENEVEIRGEF